MSSASSTRTTSDTTWPRFGRHPGDGEEWVDTMMGAPLDERAERMAAWGMPGDLAKSVAAAQGPEMGRVMLSLYRSAAQPAVSELGRGLDTAATPAGLSILATKDHFVGTAEMKRRAAGRLGAETVVLDGLGHWWMLQDAARGAEALTRFWASLD